MAMIIDGKAISLQIKDELKKVTENFNKVLNLKQTVVV